MKLSSLAVFFAFFTSGNLDATVAFVANPYLVVTPFLLSGKISNHATKKPMTAIRGYRQLPLMRRMTGGAAATGLHGMMHPNSGDVDPYEDHPHEDGDDAFDVDAVRARLEELLCIGESSAPDGTPRRAPAAQVAHKPSAKPAGRDGALYSFIPDVDVVLPPPPPLTAIERERREAEIELLGRLDQGDEALSDLWTLWFQERGPQAAARLLLAEELTGRGPQYWDQAESILRELIEEYGVYWVEPVNRLATLYYMESKFEQAESLCKMVLAVKPWHFGALSGIVMVYAGMQDPPSARQWASRRLPTVAPTGNPNRRRIAWVHKAVSDAERSLFAAEERVRHSFGRPDEHTTKSSRRRNKKNRGNSNRFFALEDEESWQ